MDSQLEEVSNEYELQEVKTIGFFEQDSSSLEISFIKPIRYTTNAICLVLISIYIIRYVLYKYSSFKKKKLNEEANDSLHKVYKKPEPTLLIIALLIYAVIYITPMCFLKPIIYIYPEQETNLTVTLGYPERITCSYPNYSKNNGWFVKAFPNGDLIDLNSNRKLYSLYWEGDFTKIDKSTKVGFCVKGEDSAKFLEEKLDELGLNYKEAEEFIVYWLPKLEANKYNFIRFVTTEEYNNYMPIKLINDSGDEVTPDTLIRVLMMYKPLNRKIDVEEQIIETPQRQGFTVVEWGGSKI